MTARSTRPDWLRIRADFPVLTRQVHGKPLVYLDSANTSQKPQAVIRAVDEFYREHNANVSRAVHALGSEATEAYEGARSKLAAFLNVPADELVLTSGTTFAINLVAYSWALPRLKAGDAIFMRNVYHHFDDPAAMNASLRASLKPGGRLAIIDFTPPPGKEAAPSRRGEDNQHGVTATTLKAELEAAGFEVISATTTDRAVHVVARRPTS